MENIMKSLRTVLFTSFSYLIIIIFFSSLTSRNANGESGHKLWLRYIPVSNNNLLQKYRHSVQKVDINAVAPTMKVAANELKRGLDGLLSGKIPITHSVTQNGIIIVGTPKNSKLVASLHLRNELHKLGKEGYLIKNVQINQKKCIVIAANTDIGVLYGSFGFLRLLQTHQHITHLNISSSPKIEYRILDHWDNLNETVERGYAGLSLWNWANLPEYKVPRYKAYARADASIGINGEVLNNVNANPMILTKKYLKKIAVLADIFRPYGIKVYVSVPFNAPQIIGHLKTYDPLNSQVQQWWNKKANQIYHYIPDFGGFLIKANSEGQPGPLTYGRTYADGANMLAKALAPHGGIVMWRAFVYDKNSKEDRQRQSYEAFKPLDGKFDKNVLLQVKNGPIDFQPREPFNPLFGALPKTQTMMEFEITQEYMGHSHWLAYLAPMYKEALDSDTYARGKGSTVAKVIDGSLFHYQKTGIAGVANTGMDRNWTGQPFGQANWFAFGRLAWNHNLSSAEIADEWIRMTFTNDPVFVKKTKKIMLASRQIGVLCRDPIGLNDLFEQPHHWGPAPWYNRGPLEWRNTYYHRADAEGIGFDRTSTGSNAISQYFPPVARKFESLKNCPEKYLLWFHHVSWNYKMKSGRTLWQELCYKYYEGVDSVRWTQKVWESLAGKIDQQRYNHVKALLKLEDKEAIWWRNACLLYFQTFSHQPIPSKYPQPKETLKYYKHTEVVPPPKY
ncbi:MAG TPA: alpha-glucuronidase family glycosyl hydrolase [Balneolales bacterium]|nr:alpha-glucuronidase family glycosyl hydrolase [Balneolales bacterium]